MSETTQAFGRMLTTEIQKDQKRLETAHHEISHVMAFAEETSAVDLFGTHDERQAIRAQRRKTIQPMRWGPFLHLMLAVILRRNKTNPPGIPGATQGDRS